ncbi:MAG: AAA family ATPase [Treponema sp.]|nr:AAA family ATPase [Treponema sp.]
MNKATTTNVFYLKKTTSSECDNNKQFGISKEVIREFFGVPETGNTHVRFKGCISGEDFLAEIQTATDPRLGNAGIREFLQKEGGVETGDYILFTKLGDKSFSVEVIKQNTEEYKCYSKLFISNTDKHAAFFTDRGNEVFATSTPSTQTPTQIIFYGVPGSGKSHSIKKELVEKGITDLKEQTKRVVFHPEYTNADFVGQILPQSSDGGKTISYPFVPGPFTQILAKAYTHQNTHYALIIEEINRGNAAAIFGELFQLLDRLDEDEIDSSNEVAYTKGWSSYSINNDNINKSIQEAYENFKSDSNFEPFINKEIFDTYKLNIGIRLPPNLSIFATMNTSDQNVFKLDNAFKRRLELKLIPNKFNNEPKEINQRDALVESFDFTWNNFREAVNSIIIAPDNSIDISSFADRQIGCWFTKAIKKDEKYIIEKEVFVHKVLEYLWDDVCNGDIGIFFNENYKSFAELVEDVIEKGITDIFSENLKGKLSQNKPE